MDNWFLPAAAVAAALLGLGAGGQTASEPPTSLAALLWRPDPALGACPGAYRERDSTPRSRAVRIRQGQRWLAAEDVAIDDRRGVARAAGGVDIGAPGLRLRARQAEFDLARGDGDAEQLDWVLIDSAWRGTADSLRRRGGVLRLANTTFTRCAPGGRAWQLRAASVAVDADAGWITARHLRVHFAGLPALYAPYARFAVDRERSSGFLAPKFGYDGEGGAELALPYYLNLAPNYDATLTARLIANRGAGVEGEFRHLGRRSRNRLAAAWLAGDERYDGAARWLWRLRHNARRGAFSTSIDTAAVSDGDYFADLDSTLTVTSQAALRRRAEIRYARGGLRARLWAEGYQRLDGGLGRHRRLPEANVAYQGGAGPLRWSATGAWAAFDGAAANAGAPEGTRLHLEPQLWLPLRRPWGALTVRAGWRHTRYALRGWPEAGQAAPRRDIHLASIDGGLSFERDLAAGRWRQTLEPRLRYFHQSHADQDHLPLFDPAPLTFVYDQLFRDNRFAGVDRIGDANQVALGVASRLVDAGTGREVVSARVGALLRLRAARVLLPGDERPARALVAGDVNARLRRLRLRASAAWDADDGRAIEAGLALAYRKGPARFLNLGLRRPAAAGIHQADVSFRWRLAPRWSAYGRWNYDWRAGQTYEGLAGFGYANCCVALKLLAHRTLRAPRRGGDGRPRANRGVVLELVLKGIGGVGGNVDARLSRAVPGFPAPF